MTGSSKKEIWKDIPSYEGLYQASNFGNIKSLDKLVGSGIKNQSQVLRKGKIMIKTIDRYGYYKLTLYKNKSQKNFTIHRLVALSFLQKVANKESINHKNGIKTDNRVCNLEWCTNMENINHGVKNKLFDFGENHHKSTLKINDLIEIKLKYIPKKYSSLKLAKEFNVTKQTILNILHNRTRKYEKY
jgi:hypothetical protein